VSSNRPSLASFSPSIPDPAFFSLPDLVLKKMRPSRWIPFVVISWGIVQTFMGIVTNYTQLLALRALLGFFECGLFPGLSFYLSSWYPRKELGFRIAIFFSSASLAGVSRLLSPLSRFPSSRSSSSLVLRRLLPSFTPLQLQLINVWFPGLWRNPRVRAFEDGRNRREGRMVVDCTCFIFASPPRGLLKLILSLLHFLQFIIEGLLTLVVGCIAPWYVFLSFLASRSTTLKLTFSSLLRFVHDFPTEKPRFLTVRRSYSPPSYRPFPVLLTTCLRINRRRNGCSFFVDSSRRLESSTR